MQPGLMELAMQMLGADGGMQNGAVALTKELKGALPMSPTYQILLTLIPCINICVNLSQEQ